MDNNKRKKFVFALIMVTVLVAAENANSGALRESPESYMPKSLDGVAVKTCVVVVRGKSTCGPDTLGEAALDSARLGWAMMEVAGTNGSDDKRWDYVVYGVTDKLCTNGGASMGVMRTWPGVFKDAQKFLQKELDGLITSGKLLMEKVNVEGLDTYMGYLHGKDCIMAFGYPSDSMVLVVFAGKDDREKVKKIIKSMLGAARSSEKKPYSTKTPSAVQPAIPSVAQTTPFSPAQSAVSETCPGSPEDAAARLDAATKTAAAQGYEPLPFVKVSEGGYLVNEMGLSLYTYKNDKLCKSNCEGICLDNWPPLTPNGNFLTGDKTMKGILGFISIDYVKTHITYNGMPLYFWKNDVNPGDTLGDGVGGVWFLAKP